MRRRGSLRLRLLSAFVAVSVPPLLLLSGSVLFLLDRAFDTAVTRRLDAGQRSASQHFQDLQARSARAIGAIAQDLGSGPLDEALAGRLAEAHQLQVLELLDGEGRVLSSAHWPAGLGLPDNDQTFVGAPSIRRETTAEGYGSSERLTLTASRSAVRAGKPILVRGGYLLDEALWQEMHALLGLEIGLWDGTRCSFVTGPGSPLRTWSPPAGAGKGILPDAAGYQWTSSRMGDALALYVAAPTGEWETLARRVRAASLAAAGLGLAVALLVGFGLARRIAGPATALAAAAERVAAGDLAVRAPEHGEDELAHLGRTFNQMTEHLRTTQERLLQAERVAAWREIARRLAHELKNPIFPIALSMQTLQRATADVRLPIANGIDLTSLLRESVQTTLDELRRLQRVVDEFGAFARMPQPRLAPTDLNDVVASVVALYQSRAGHVEVRTELDPTLPSMSVDADLLARALGNLVANALEAMPDGGRLTIRAVPHPGGVVLEVEDSGPGLSPQQQTRLFTPYFTTKPGGTGLGLAIVQGIASDHGGRLEYRAAPEGGSVFSIVLPPPAGDVRHSPRS